MTIYQSKYWATQLTLQSPSDSVERLSRSISNAKVDLQPHQVDAALFAFRSPLAKGVLLADEVGLGKTIEAGMIMLQKWAERKRKILLILPASLRTQWQQELEEKFFLPSEILESKTYNQFKKEGHYNPFDQAGKIVICSYHFASNKIKDVSSIEWDLIVMDEAHRLRNVYKTSNKLAKTLKDNLERFNKLLLTATPLQNSLMELFGLFSFLDPHVFGDQKSFKNQFMSDDKDGGRYRQLRDRIKPLCTRTLRKQVLEYINYTKRIATLCEFTPSDEEQYLYEEVSNYLQREMLYALPVSQRSLMTLVIRKLLASSTFAITPTLHRLIDRLEANLQESDDRFSEVLEEEFEGYSELKEEWENEEGQHSETSVNQTLLKQELETLKDYAKLAESITHNEKAKALLSALETAFKQVESMRAAKKAIIFTESRRTQAYLYEWLSKNGYDGQLALLNGSNNDDRSKEIVTNWRNRHTGSDKITGIRSVDMKAAIVEEFRENSTILIATEAAAEGINLQFCSLVINYDLPWNPQRIEQRIGRCHRYGQKHDVVVVNFLNKRNAADQRVYQLLAEKFKLFDGVFGSSDDVLGALESGVDIEKQIANIYQTCRTVTEIQTAFDTLQTELEDQVQNRLSQTQQAILDNFDEDVAVRLRVHSRDTHASLDEREKWLFSLTKFELRDEAKFDNEKPRFIYQGSLGHHGTYHIQWPEADKEGDYFYRLDSPLAQAILETSLKRPLPKTALIFCYQDYGANISALEPFIGQSGYLSLTKVCFKSFETLEYLLISATTDSGQELDETLAAKLLNIPAVQADLPIGAIPEEALQAIRAVQLQNRQVEFNTRNARFFDEEAEKLERWSDDLKNSLEIEIKELDKTLTEKRRDSTRVIDLSEKLELQKEMRNLEKKRKTMRQRLYDEQDKIDEKRDAMIARVEEQINADCHQEELFTIRWSLQKEVQNG